MDNDTTTICEKSFATDACYSNFYAGGDVAWSSDGSRIYCLNTTEVCVVNVSTGQVLQAYGVNAAATTTDSATEAAKVKATSDEDDVDEDVIYCFALALNEELLATAHRSGLLRLWSLESGKVLKLWKAQHKGPVIKLVFSPCGKLLCSSGGDSTLRIWDYGNSRCMCALKDYAGPALVLTFHPQPMVKKLYAVGSDHSIYCWDYESRQLEHKMRGHLSQVTALSFGGSNDLELLASVSRDKVLIVWDLANGAQHKVIPIYEELEGVFFYADKVDERNSGDLLVACSKGHLKVVNYKASKISTLLEADGHCDITLLLHCKDTNQLAVVTAEQNILIYDILAQRRLKCTKQLIGFNDEVLDMCLLGGQDYDRFLAVATNSKNFKIYDIAHEMNCKIVVGHTDTVLTLASANCSTTNCHLVLSTGKDQSIMLWELEPETFVIKCLAKNESSHTSTIGSIAFAFNTVEMFASVCQSGSLKVWTLKKSNTKSGSSSDECAYRFAVTYSAIAHDKEVNSVTFAPNNKVIATASQDKTAKLWSAEKHACIGTLRGHTRGVWSARFSPVDQVVLTASSDCSLRLWSLASLACLKRFDQECTVLRAEFIDSGRFIVSTASDGLIKIWNIKTNTCVQTLDEHSDRVWSLAVSQHTKKCFYSGGADSKMVRWHDVTEQCRNKEIDKRQQLLQQEQLLQSLLQQRQQMQKAFMLALKLGKPKISYQILSQYVRQRDLEAVKNAISPLNADQRVSLVEHVKAWSTNSRHCQVSNVVLHNIVSELIANPGQRLYNTSNLVEVLTPYVQRHFKRVSELTNELAFLEFLVKCM